jgi:hypothetical protein
MEWGTQKEEERDSPDSEMLGISRPKRRRMHAGRSYELKS